MLINACFSSFYNFILFEVYWRFIGKRVRGTEGWKEKGGKREERRGGERDRFYSINYNLYI